MNPNTLYYSVIKMNKYLYNIKKVNPVAKIASKIQFYYTNTSYLLNELTINKLQYLFSGLNSKF